MSVTAQDVQNVIDVSGILANNEVAVKPNLVADLIDWKAAAISTPTNAVSNKGSSRKTPEPTPDPAADDPGF